jgi:intracellular sulfur oxidation DsrE/DsrF family protein
MNEQDSKSTHRRSFITTILSGAAAFGISSVVAPFKSQAEILDHSNNVNDAEKWFRQVKGKHKMVFDVTKHHDGAAISWALTLMDTYNDMGTPDKDLCFVIVLRAGGTPLAFADPLWSKYEFGKRIEMKDPETKEFALKNLFAKCKTEDDDCIELFQKRGGLVCVCNHAMNGMSDGIATQLKLKKEDVLKEFINNLLPEIQLVPAGIWAVNRAQESGCSFCFGG